MGQRRRRTRLMGTRAHVLLAILAMGVFMRKRSTIRPEPRPAVVRMRNLIRAEAIRQGVPVELALATARVESAFDPAREGDKNWHLNLPRFAKNVPAKSPYRAYPELWHSYGLFQLLAPYNVSEHEDPRILLDPAINAQRGVAYLKRLYDRFNGDPTLIRLHYTNNDEADAATQTRILAIWQKALNTERSLA